MTDSEIKWLQQNDSITVAFFPYYPPYQFINEDGDIVGVFVEYLDLLEKKVGYKFKRKYYQEWPTMLSDIQNKNVDIAVEIQSTKSRSTYLNFYAELFESKHVITARKGTIHSKKLSDYNNKKITVPQDYAVLENLKQKYPKLTFIEDENDLVCLKKLNSGEYDAYIGPRAVVNYIIKTQNLDNLKIVSETGLVYKPGITVHKKNRILNDIIQKAVNNISTTESQNLIENWLYTETKPFYKKTNFLIPVLLILLTGIIILIAINFYLSFIVKRKTKELRIAKDIAEKDDQLKTAFIHNVSHEINTPINGIRVFSERLSESKLTPSEKKKYTSIIKASSDQLIENINNILEVSQLETKQIKLNPEKTDLYEMLDTIHSIFDVKTKEKGILLILNNNLKENQRYVIIDKSKLTKTISGIVENSIKFTDKGSILISCMIQNSKLIIMVRDSGKGINIEEQAVIFENFTRSKDIILKKHERLGLGLTIAKENVNLMKGELSFSSIPNQGSTFRLEIPYTPIIDDIDDQKHFVSSDSIPKKPKTKQHILLIAEDGEVNFLFLKTILKKIKEYDFIIHRAKDGKEAVQFCLENKQIDLVLMDIKMPEMNGYDATRIIKKMDPNIQIIAQTAYSTKDDIKKALEAGCDNFISKPISVKALNKVLQKSFKKK